MPLSVATWNINSVRLRIDLVRDFLKKHRPDVLCLQEIKCPEDRFPHTAFSRLGYKYRLVNGQKGYHGVAIVSRLPFLETEVRGFCGKDDARHTAATVDDGSGGVTLHNFYVPAGGDEPDPAINDKFAHKLAFLDEMKGWLSGAPAERKSIIVGDLNVAPYEHDVWSHKQLLRVVSHTPVETELLENVRTAGGWVDAIRRFVPMDEKIYTWWSYRAADWQAADRGRRLDHIWLSDSVAGRLQSYEILRIARGWQRPSDHVPVIARLGD